MKHVIGAILLAGLLGGCAMQSFDINPAVGPLGQADLETSQVFFLEGIAQGATVDAAQVCGGAGNVIRVEVEQNVLDNVLRVITAGIYTPRTARVYCKA